MVSECTHIAFGVVTVSLVQRLVADDACVLRIRKHVRVVMLQAHRLATLSFVVYSLILNVLDRILLQPCELE